MARGFKLFHTLFLVFAWQYCAKVGASFSFKDVTGFFDRNFNYGSFGSGGVGILDNIKGDFVPDAKTTNPPKLAPGMAPVGLKTLMNKREELTPGIAPVGVETLMNNKGDEALSFGIEITKKIKDGAVVSNDLKSDGNIALSHGRIISRKIEGGGKIGLRS